MRKTIFSLFALLCVNSLCFAQQTPVSKAAVSQKSAASAATKTLAAKVDAVTIGDPMKGTESELAVVANDGGKSSFVVKSGISITGKDAKAISLSDLKKEDKVTVEYVTKSGSKKAISIKLVE